MPTTDDSVYLPALKWKQGEHFAVKLLTAAQKTRVLPIAEVPDRPFDWPKNKYTKSWDKHLADVVVATSKNWGVHHELAVDQCIDPDDQLASNPGTPWEYLLAQMWAADVRAVPVLSSRASGAEQAALIKVAKEHKKSRWLLRFRANTDGVVPNASAVESWFVNAMATLGVKHSQVDAVLDLGHVPSDAKPLVQGTATALASISSLGPWRRLALLSGAFPVNLAGVPKGTKTVPRADWDLHKRVKSRAEMSGITLEYGDYGIAHVDAFDEDPRKLKMTANLRYAHWKDWHVLKGTSVRDYGYDQYRDLCKVLVGLPLYMQESFSPGDANYESVATNPSAGPGNATQWRRDATNHHIHVVLHQLANLPEF